jgi:high-affinity iron transporter
MLATAVIVFRETLEAALFVGIVAAATRGMDGRARWLAGGVAAGALGALALALLAENIAALADGLGQDLVNVAILGAALAMLGWHCIWGTEHGREAAADARRMGTQVRAGTRAPLVLAAVCALAVLREGVETLLFVMGQTAGQGAAAASPWPGIALGLSTGITVGALLYLGLSRIPAHRVFAVTQFLIVLVTAAIASQLARALAQAGLVQSWSEPLWDTSRWLAPDSPLGTLLHALAGYDAQPSGLQLAFYTATLLSLWLASRMIGTPVRRGAARA